MAEKVGQRKNGKGEEKKEDKGKKPFPIKGFKAMMPVLDAEGKATEELKLQNAVNDDGQLLAVPVEIPGKNDGDAPIQIGFSVGKHESLKKEHFANIVVFLKYQAMVARQKADKLIKLAEEKEKKADKLEKFGDDALRKKANRLQRMREQIAKLEAQLTADGVNLEDID